MLNWKVVTKSLSSFAAISFVLCVGYGLVAPSALHAAWWLEALLPGFTWLSVGSFVLGVIESALLLPAGGPRRRASSDDGASGVNDGPGHSS